VINFGYPDGKKVYDLVKRVVNHTLPDSGTLHQFASYGGLSENNWKEQPNGENYSRWLATRGRSDLLRTVTNILRPQIDALNEEWRARKARDAIAKRFGERGPEPEVGSRPAASIMRAILGCLHLVLVQLAPSLVPQSR
jgi:hypothetical protein